MNYSAQTNFLEATDRPDKAKNCFIGEEGLIWRTKDGVKLFIGFWPKPCWRLEAPFSLPKLDEQWLFDSFHDFQLASVLTGKIREEVLKKIVLDEHSQHSGEIPEQTPPFAEMLKHYKRNSESIKNFLKQRHEPARAEGVTAWEQKLPEDIRNFWETEKFNNAGYGGDSRSYGSSACPVIPFIVQLSGSHPLRSLFSEIPALAIWTVATIANKNLYAASQEPLKEVQEVASLPIPALLERLRLPPTGEVQSMLQRLPPNCWNGYSLENIQRICQKEEALDLLCTAPILDSGFIALRWTIHKNNPPLAYFTREAWHEILQMPATHNHRQLHQPFLQGAPPEKPFDCLQVFRKERELNVQDPNLNL